MLFAPPHGSDDPAASRAQVFPRALAALAGTFTDKMLTAAAKAAPAPIAVSQPGRIALRPITTLSRKSMPTLRI
jgi:hypothetical protein